MKTKNIQFKTVKINENRKFLGIKRYLFKVSKKQINVNNLYISSENTISSVLDSNEKQIKQPQNERLVIPAFLNDIIQYKQQEPKVKLERYEAILWNSLEEESKEKKSFILDDNELFSFFPLRV